MTGLVKEQPKISCIILFVFMGTLNPTRSLPGNVTRYDKIL